MKHKIAIIVVLFILLANTGYAQLTDTLKKDTSKATANTVQVRRQSVAAYIVPAALITYGALSFHVNAIRNIDHYMRNNVSNGHPRFINHVDDVLQFAPAAAVYGLNLFNVKGKHNFADRTAALLIAEGIMGTSILFIKHQTDRTRPNGYDVYSFPSGHAGKAFVAAEFLSQEYGDVSVWYTVGGYAVATATGALRVYNGYHLFSDVVAGAGIGIASAKLAYLVYPVIKKTLWPRNPNPFVMLPTYQQHMVGVYLAGAF